MLKRNSFLAVGIAALALPCLSDAAMAKCQLKKEVLLEITSEIGGLAKDLFAAAADEEIDYFQASAAGVEHGAKIIDKLVSGPDFGEAFTQLDKDLKDIGSTLFDEIQNIGLFNVGYKSLETAITAGQRAIKQGKLLPQFGDDDTASQDAVRSAYATDDMSKRAVNDCANDGGTHWTDIKALAKKAEEYKTNDTAWEWRRSVPYLMSAIPLRLWVIETMDPNWRTDRLFDKELYNSDLNNSDPTKRIPGHANGLEAMFNKMTGAVQCAAQSSPGGCGLLSCNPPTPYHVACADVSTGLSVEATRDRTATADQLNNLQAVFKSQLIEQMPLFEMRSM